MADKHKAPGSPYRDLAEIAADIPPSPIKRPLTRAQRLHRRLGIGALCIAQAPILVGASTDIARGTSWPGLLLGCQALSVMVAVMTFVGAPFWFDIAEDRS